MTGEKPYAYSFSAVVSDSVASIININKHTRPESNSSGRLFLFERRCRMTDIEKRDVTLLRMSGVGYKQIASNLGLPVSTVKSYCQRSGLSVSESEPQSSYTDFNQVEPQMLYPDFNQAESHSSNPDPSSCEQCGRNIDQAPGRKVKRFCSDACRMKWWRGHKAQMAHRVSHTIVCSGCGARFEVYGRDERRYCCRSCYMSHRFQKYTSKE